MITYLLVALFLFFTSVFAAKKLNKRYSNLFYSDADGKMAVVGICVVGSLLWVGILPILVLVGLPLGLGYLGMRILDAS